MRFKKHSKSAGITEFTVAELTMLAQNDITLAEDAQAQFEKMIDVLEDLEDVQRVYHNVDLRRIKREAGHVMVCLYF